jgi:putative NADH-flavin reductase
MKICILGASGMLGHTLFSELSHRGFDVYGTIRGSLRVYAHQHRQRILEHIDALDMASLVSGLDALAPDVVINAIGLI